MAKKFSLKSLFIQDDGLGQKPESVPEKKTDLKPSVPPSAPQPTIQSPPMAGGSVDRVISDSLAQALEEANQQGYDYFEFAKAVEQQKSFIESEQVRFQASHAAAAVMGITPASLIASAQQYLNVLKAKEKEFNEALKQSTASEVDNRQKEIAKMEAEIAKKAEMITRLTQEIQDLQKNSKELGQQIQASREKIDTVRQNFAATFTIFVGRITSDIEKINRYLTR